jgi:predicted phosphodiesterase
MLCDRTGHELMRIAVIGDVHGYAPGLTEALRVIDELACEAIVCVGDIVDGHPENDRVVDLLRSRTDVISIRGNHDVIDLDDLRFDNRRWLLNLPVHAHLHGFDFYHFSPRLKDEKINSAIKAWNAFDDADFSQAVVGHAHIRALFRYATGMGPAAEELRHGSHDYRLEAGYRHIVVNPSLSYNRDRPAIPAFTFLDTTAMVVRFVSLNIAPMNTLLRR